MISLLVDGLSHSYSLAIPFHFVLSVKYNTCLWSTVAHLVERLTGDRRIASLRLTASGVTVFCASVRHFYICCIVLVEHRKKGYCPDMTEKIPGWERKKHQDKRIMQIKIFIETKEIFFQHEKYFFKLRN